MKILLDSIFFSVTVGHLTNDFVSGQRYVLLTYLIGIMGLSNTSLGLISMIFMLIGSTSQPFFGILSDRFGPRWVIFGGLIWLGSFYSIGLVVPGVVGLALFVISSLGSGAFHPAGTMVATERGNNVMMGKETIAAAIFFLFGQIGLFLAPLFAGVVLETAGILWLILILAMAIPVAINALLKLRNFPPFQFESNHEKTGNSKVKFSAFLIGIFALVAAFQSWSQQNMVTFIPKYLSDLGESPGMYGLISSFYMAGYAFGNLVGGHFADKFGKRRVAAVMFALGSIPILLIPVLELSFYLMLMITISGFFTGGAFSIIVVLAQNIIPGGRGFSSGLILGFIFASGAIGTMFSGYIADITGIVSVFIISSGLMAIASALSLLMRKFEEALEKNIYNTSNLAAF